MANKLVLMVYADYTRDLGKISREGVRRVGSIIAPLKEVLKGDYSFFSSRNRNTVDTALAIADGLKEMVLLHTRSSLYYNNWELYDKFYKEAVERTEDCIIAVGHKKVVEEFPDFLAERIGKGWGGRRAEERGCCQGYVYDLKAKTWQLFPEDFRGQR